MILQTRWIVPSVIAALLVLTPGRVACNTGEYLSVFELTHKVISTTVITALLYIESPPSRILDTLLGRVSKLAKNWDHSLLRAHHKLHDRGSLLEPDPRNVLNREAKKQADTKNKSRTEAPMKKHKGEIFSSTSDLQHLMHFESRLVRSLGEYVATMEENLSKIKRYVSNWEKTAAGHGFHENEPTANPLQVYQLIKRLTVDLRSINEQVNKGTQHWTRVQRLTQEQKAIMPSERDLHGVALSISRLQRTYNLSAEQLAKGQIQDQSTGIEMTARDCLHLAKHAFNNAYYGHSFDWFREALRRAHIEGNTTGLVDEIRTFQQTALELMEELGAKTKGCSLDNHYICMEAAGNWKDMARISIPKFVFDDYVHYQALCRGEERRSPKDEAPLRCYLRHNNHPLLYLQPIRVEVHNISPYVSVIHNLMSEREAKTIRQLAAPTLARSMVHLENTDSETVAGTRTSQTAWFSPDTHPIVQRITRRIEAATGLSADMTDSHCEYMHVANYAVGGHYAPHYDYHFGAASEQAAQLTEDDLYSGDRTATLMFYLSDVTRGGSTVFTRLGVQVEPELGAAAFWYNLYRNGTGIVDTMHAACPVLMGEKWVANFWIRDRGQFTRRRCTLNKDE